MRNIVNVPVSFDPPPNYGRILAVFPQAARPGVIFAYAGTIHNPSRVKLPKELLAHEVVHFDQQAHYDAGMRAGAAAWWDRYLEDVEWRYQQELAAHIAEAAQFNRRHAQGNARIAYRRQVARKLSGDLYGGLRTFDQALNDLTEGLYGPQEKRA